jgi:hypothetical protein
LTYELTEERIFWFFFFGALISFAAFQAYQKAHGENYVYNFTDEEKQEFNLMVLCYGDALGIELNSLSIGNISLNQFCWERYGGFDTTYGEAKK